MSENNAFDLSPLSSAVSTGQHAVKISQEWVPDDYDEKVDERILGVKYRPDAFQKQAFYFLAASQPVFVSAHTSSGKTLVAEYSIFRAQKNGTRVIYTSPIKALSNQKFYDFKQKFDSVGLITGDVQVNPDAQCLIMTTEILRNLVYKNSDLLRDTEYVVFDEVHYINDADRGVVWEESIIMMPRHISLVMLSATIPNAMEFSEWVGRTRRQCVYVISTNKRAVPLEYAVYCDCEAYALDDARSGKEAPPRSIKEARSNKGSNFPAPLAPYSKKTRAVGRFRISDLGNFIANRRLMPAIFFSFSKKTCEEYGGVLQLLDLTNPMEKRKIAQFIDSAVGTLADEDRFLPQIITMRAQAYRGVAVHHGGLLPFVKECVEILFSQNLIKILVATETFAMGVNMPAKCCVFLSITKMTNGVSRFLSAGEFVQMSGRAGRRGMDRVGTVIIADQRTHPIEAIKKMVNGVPYNLCSQFKLSFSLILMAARSNIEVEELMRSSFREHGVQRNFGADMARVAQLETREAFACGKCTDISLFLGNLAFISKENSGLVKAALQSKDLLILKSNAIVEVVEITAGGIKVKNVNVPVQGNLFCKSAEDAPSCVDTAKYCKYPPTLHSTEHTTEAPFEAVFALLKNGRISFDYGATDIHSVSVIEDLNKACTMLENAACLKCPSFESHYYEAIRTIAVQRELAAIKNKYSRQSLIQIDEYAARIKFLTKYNFLENDAIALKGRVAAEIRTINEVLVTEMIFRNQFREFDSAELIAVFSAMIHEAREEEEFELAEVLKDKAAVLEEVYAMLAAEMDELGVPAMEPLRFGMANAVYDWCQGVSLGIVVARHRVQEGTFVRLVMRLEECCREMLGVSDLIGNESLKEKFEDASMRIKRDIVFQPSLYI